MATTKELIDFPERLPSKSGWANLKSWLLRAVQTLGCCGTPSQFRDLECYRTDELVRSRVRSEMRMHLGYEGRGTCVSNVIDTVLKDTGYDLSDMGTIRQANEGVKRTEAQWDAYFKRIGVDPLAESHIGPARIVPKFAAACVLHLRAKLGVLSKSEANVLLVQRKYLEVCRKHRVRDVDTVLHQGFVMNAMFTESVLDDIASSRRRLPAWIKFLEEVPETGSVPQAIC